MQPAVVSSVGLVALAGARHRDWAEKAVTKCRPCPVKKGGEKKEGRWREGGEREAGSGSSARAPQRASPGAAGSAARAARAPATGRPTGHDPPWSLDNCLPRTLYRTLPPTGLDTTTDTTSQLRTLLPTPFPRLWTLSPSAGAQTLSPPQAPTSVLLHPSAGHPPPGPLLSSRLISTRFGSEHLQFLRSPRCSGEAARAPIPRLLARMPLPGGLWWLLCCRRGFTLLHRDYGDGELSGDGDDDDDDETFELRTPSPAGGGRVSLERFSAVFNPSHYNRSSRLIRLHTRAKRRPFGQVEMWGRFLSGGQSSGSSRGKQPYTGCACGPRAALRALSTCWGP